VAFRLSRSDQTNIHYRWNNALAPVLTIESGDEVVVETRSGEDDQLKPGDTAEALDRVDFSRRLHALTGPIAVAGARPGDALAVHILQLQTGAFGFTMQRPGRGLLTDFAPYLRFYRLTGEAAAFEPGIEVPIRPFLGVMGVAPAEAGEHSTVPPGRHGGNLDCRDLVAGATLFLPVFVPGALFSCGDGHAGQGDGEVCVTAIECAMTTRFRFELLKGLDIAEPQAETPDAYMTLSAAPTLEEASRSAISAMLELVGRLSGLGRADAYALASVGIDVRINQVVNHPMMGVRAVLPKRLIYHPA
jgi:acetamidase/formamidase